jgi:hypothetical protein
VNANPWVRILGGSSLSGGGVVTYAVDANPSATERSGILEIGEQIFTITQSGVPCTYALTPGMRTHGHGAASNAFTITAAAGCSWQVGNTNGWITIASGASGSGDGTVGYRVEANPFPEERFGRLTIEGETFIITQRAAVCSFALSPTMRNHGYGATTGSVTVMTLEGCDWAVVNTNTWITITSGTSGSGHGVVNYTVAANNVTAPRSGTITIGDALFSVSQSALNCTYKLSPTNRNHGFGSTTGSVSVTAGPGCAWTVATTNHWISFTSAPNGTGNGTIGYSIPANFGHTARAGAITLNDEHALVITQDAAGNAFSFRWLRLQNGQVSVRLDGGPAGIWELQSSTNLATWTRVADLTNTTGRVEFTTPAPAGPRRFYRAILP